MYLNGLAFRPALTSPARPPIYAGAARRGAQARAMPAAGPEKEDRVEVWGRRFGRGLGYLVVLGLIVYLMAVWGPKW
jgi:hypothetical protein